jgi:AraC-like DNA-binding protein
MPAAPQSFDLPRGFFDEWSSRSLRIDDHVRMLVVSPMLGRDAIEFGTRRSALLGVNLVLRGRGRYVEGSGREHELRPGVLFHRFPGIEHTTDFDPASGYAELFVVVDAMTGPQLMASGLIDPSPVLEVGVDPVIIQSFRHLVKRLNLPESRMPARRALLEAVGFINELYDRAHANRALPFWERIVEDACRLLERNFDERLPAETVARRLGVSYAAFRKQFRARTGHSPVEYRIRRRLESAQHALMVKSVTATAREYGYPDPYTFSAQFRKYVGVPPRQFQRRMRERPVVVPLARTQRPASVRDASP